MSCACWCAAHLLPPCRGSAACMDARARKAKTLTLHTNGGCPETIRHLDDPQPPGTRRLHYGRYRSLLGHHQPLHFHPAAPQPSRLGAASRSVCNAVEWTRRDAPGVWTGFAAAWCLRRLGCSACPKQSQGPDECCGARLRIWGCEFDWRKHAAV